MQHPVNVRPVRVMVVLVDVFQPIDPRCRPVIDRIGRGWTKPRRETILHQPTKCRPDMFGVTRGRTKLESDEGI